MLARTAPVMKAFRRMIARVPTAASEHHRVRGWSIAAAEETWSGASCRWNLASLGSCRKREHEGRAVTPVSHLQVAALCARQ